MPWTIILMIYNYYICSLRSRRYSPAQGGEAWNTACPKTKHFEFSGSWVTERSDWLEYRFEFMIDKKLLLVFI